MNPPFTRLPRLNPLLEQILVVAVGARSKGHGGRRHKRSRERVQEAGDESVELRQVMEMVRDGADLILETRVI